MATRRITVRGNDSSRSKERKAPRSSNPGSRSGGSPAGLTVFHWVAIAFYLAGVFQVVKFLDAKLPERLEDTVENRKQPQFLEGSARKCLKTLTDIGPRTTGSPALEVEAVNFLLERLQKLKDSIKNPKYDLEIDVQRPSDCFNLEIFTAGRTMCYQDVTNIVARISTKWKKPQHRHALLVNCHTDSRPNTAGLNQLISGSVTPWKFSRPDVHSKRRKLKLLAKLQKHCV